MMDPSSASAGAHDLLGPVSRLLIAIFTNFGMFAYLHQVIGISPANLGIQYFPQTRNVSINLNSHVHLVCEDERLS